MCFISYSRRLQRKSPRDANAPASRPMPTRVTSNGEFDAPPVSPQQRRVAELVEADAAVNAPRLGLSRRAFLRSAAGMAATFLAMNAVYGPHFWVETADAADAVKGLPDLGPAGFVFDDQLHFVHDDFRFPGLLDLREYAGEHWNPAITDEPRSFETIQFHNFVREVLLGSETAVGLLSGASADDPMDMFLANSQQAKARDMVNRTAGWRKLLSHAIILPGHDNWLNELDRCLHEYELDSVKGYTVGDPLSQSAFPYRLDDEALMYPAYEKMVAAGVKNICIHKGLVPNDYLESYPNWPYAAVEDVPKAAKDWPELNFIIYHAALKPLNDFPEAHLEAFERTGRIDWVSDLAEIPEQHGVSNVHADLGTCFANSCVSHPRHAAALLGILEKGLGADKIHWGTDAIWYGSPQWQIEAFRRLRTPEDLQEKYGYLDIGGPDSSFKKAVLGENAARLYGVDVAEAMVLADDDPFGETRRRMAQAREESEDAAERVAQAFIEERFGEARFPFVGEGQA